MENKICNQVFVSAPAGKMAGIPTITTSMMDNPICAARSRDKDSVCSHCYARKGLGIYAAARKRYHENTVQLSGHELEPYEIPTINSVVARFESHGDLVNVVHARNYLKICRANPWCVFSIWTKNAALLDEAIKLDGKPENLICVFSSDRLNVVDDTYKKYPWVDKVFTVYDKDFIANNDIDINCGAKSCTTCRKCYTKTDVDFFIRERLK